MILMNLENLLNDKTEIRSHFKQDIFVPHNNFVQYSFQLNYTFRKVTYSPLIDTIIILKSNLTCIAHKSLVNLHKIFHK